MLSDASDVVQAVAALQSGADSVAWLRPDGRSEKGPADAVAGVFSGAFNPLHDGHHLLRETAENVLGGPVCFELTISNADKPRLDAPTVAERLRQFPADRELVAVTAATTFAEKARVFSGMTFVIGIDTAERILQTRFYGENAESMEAALADVREAACRFLVAGRLLGDSFSTLRQLPIPREFSDLFVELPEARFRADVSSTELRGGDR